MRRRSLLLLPLATPAAAEGWPTRTIRLVIPRAPGGGSDNLARVFAGPLSARLGQTVLPDNRADATTVVGTELVARSAPDGHTLLLVDNAFYQNPAILPALPYDTLRDFSAVTMLAEAPVILLVPAAGPPSLTALIAAARAAPGRLSFASGGVGASTHLAGVQFNLAAGTEILHVPFRSSGPAVTALLAGQVTMQFGGPSSARQLIEAGTVRALAITGARRDPTLPEVPTFAEAGLPSVDIASVWGLHAPAAVPLPLRRQLRDAIVDTFAEPAVAARLAQLGYQPVLSTPEAHQARTAALVTGWIEVGKRVNLRE